MPPPLTVAIITGNEEGRIADAIRSARWSDEVLILDSESSDGTVEVARAHGARVVVEPWRGFGAQKNRAAELAAHDWVLSLDADERVTSALATAVGDLPEVPSCAAYRVRRRNFFAAMPIRHWPWAWDRTVRLYDRRRARFSEAVVHESLQVDGEVGELQGVLDHYTYRDLDDYLERQQRYARLGAEQIAARGRGPKAGDLALRPLITFLRHYLVRGYLLGGARGLRLSLLAARGTRLKYALLRQHRRV